MRGKPVHALALGLAEGEVLDADPVGIGMDPLRDPLDAIGGEQPHEDQRHGQAPPAQPQVAQEEVAAPE